MLAEELQALLRFCRTSSALLIPLLCVMCYVVIIFLATAPSSNTTDMVEALGLWSQSETHPVAQNDPISDSDRGWTKQTPFFKHGRQIRTVANRGVNINQVPRLPLWGGGLYVRNLSLFGTYSEQKLSSTAYLGPGAVRINPWSFQR